MAWIESHQTLEKHGKLLELASLLGIQKHQLIGHLHSLWWWTIDSAPSGNISKYSPLTIAEAAGWMDHVAWWHVRQVGAWNDSDHITSGRFVAVLVDCGFIDRDGGSKNIQDGRVLGGNARVHDWLDFCGDLVKKRLERKVEKNSKSNELRESIEGKNKPKETGNKNPLIEGRNVPPTVPYRTVPNQVIKEKEEKKKEEKEKNALSRERTDEIKAQIQAFYDLCPYLKPSRRDNSDLLQLAMNTPKSLWDGWLFEIHKNRPLKDAFEYWAGSLRARLQEFNGEALKNEARGDKRLIGEIMRGMKI